MKVMGSITWAWELIFVLCNIFGCRIHHVWRVCSIQQQKGSCFLCTDHVWRVCSVQQQGSCERGALQWEAWELIMWPVLANERPQNKWHVEGTHRQTNRRTDIARLNRSWAAPCNKGDFNLNGGPYKIIWMILSFVSKIFRNMMVFKIMNEGFMVQVWTITSSSVSTISFISKCILHKQLAMSIIFPMAPWEPV